MPANARDAFIIAFRRTALPHTLRRVDTRDAAPIELEVLVGFDDDLAGEAPASFAGSADCSLPSTQTSNGSSVPALPTPPSSRSSRPAADPPGSDSR
jgi:hypothetical protein